MAQTRHTAQLKNSHFRVAVKTALLRHPRIHSVSALAARIDRPRSSVSRAINNGIFPELQKEIAEALDL